MWNIAARFAATFPVLNRRLLPSQVGKVCAQPVMPRMLRAPETNPCDPMTYVFKATAVRVPNVGQALAGLLAVVALLISTPVFGPAQAGGVVQAPAVETPATPTAPLVVGSKVAPPFAMKDEKGNWTGLSIDLWTAIATSLNRPFEFREYPTTADMIDAAAAGKIDAGVAATTITGEREKAVDFSHPFYQTGLAIAISNQRSSTIWDIFKALASPAFLTTVGALLALLFVTGAILWFVERKRNWDQFDEKPVSGIGDGFWWAAVTMTTVGYGDKAPITPLGRAIAVIWMFAALILTALFTAQLASSLTIQNISGPVAGPADLPRARVGVMEKTASGDYFRDRFIATRPSGDVATGLQALADNRIDAFVHDAPILKYEILKGYQGQLQILPGLVETQNYGIVLPPRSPNRERINQALLQILSSDAWPKMRERYFGSEGS
jgi:polar amino acid transport system substrate-binding protein